MNFVKLRHQLTFSLFIYQILLLTFLVIGLGFAFGLLTAGLFKLYVFECPHNDDNEFTCAKGDLWNPEDAVIYEPYWILKQLKSNNDDDKYGAEIIKATYEQARTVIIDCESNDPSWSSPQAIVKLYADMHKKFEKTTLPVPQFWIRLAKSADPDTVNISACHELVTYAARNAQGSFQGILIEADNLLEDFAQLSNISEKTNLENAISTSLGAWESHGANVGLLIDSDSCQDVISKIPRTFLIKFHHIFYLEDQIDVLVTDEVPYVTLSREYKSCRNFVACELPMHLAIADMSNLFAHTDPQICLTNA